HTLTDTPLLPLFFLKYPSSTEIYTLSLHDALPISRNVGRLSPRLWPRCSNFALLRCDAVPATAARHSPSATAAVPKLNKGRTTLDRKSTRLNSSHSQISYAVFCLKKKKKRM